jgi:hypothetical protein
MKNSRASAKVPAAQGWRELYIAALFESDRNRIGEKIGQAQVAIGARRREIFLSGNDAHERQVLDTPLFSLQSLSNCLAITPRITGGARAA